VFAQVAPTPPKPTRGDGGDLTNNEITNNERKSEPAQEAGERDPWATEVPAKLAATNSPLPLPTSADAVRSADASPCSASAVASATPLSSRPADASEPADLDKLREEWHKRDERRRELGVIPERKRFAWRED
jgi:hypothetical protein